MCRFSWIKNERCKRITLCEIEIYDRELEAEFFNKELCSNIRTGEGAKDGQRSDFLSSFTLSETGYDLEWKGERA